MSSVALVSLNLWRLPKMIHARIYTRNGFHLTFLIALFIHPKLWTLSQPNLVFNLSVEDTGFFLDSCVISYKSERKIG